MGMVNTPKQPYGLYIRENEYKTFCHCPMYKSDTSSSLFPYRKSTLLWPLLKIPSPQKTVVVERLRQLLMGPLRAQSLPSTLRFRTTRTVMRVVMGAAYSAVTSVPAPFTSSVGKYMYI